MAHLLHVDGAAGISGDMTLGALVDLGVPVERLVAGLGTLRVSGWTLEAERVVQHGLAATKAHVRVTAGGGHPDDVGWHDHQHSRDERHHDEHEHGRTFADLAGVIDASGLSRGVKDRAIGVFRRLCDAEARVHGTSLERAHLHEAGAVDAIVDVCGACLGFELLDWPTISCSPPELGSGTIRCQHGVLPVPAPATLEILRGFPTRGSEVPAELVTPTGAALLAALSSRWGALPPMRVLKIGLGAGTRQLPDRANVVRFTLGEVVEARDAADRDAKIVVEADVDDANPQILAAAVERLFDAGASDVTQSSVVMKKGRSGTRLSVLCGESAREAVVEALFRETTTIGCRFHEVRRAECERRNDVVDTPYGPVRVKTALWNGRVVNRKPEHDDCASAASRTGVPLKDVVAAASAATLSLDQEEKP